MSAVSVAQVCDAAEEILRAHLPDVVDAAGRGPGTRDALGRVKRWDQVPTLAALMAANPASFPTGGVTTPGLAGPPVRQGAGAYDATWRIEVGVFDRASTWTTTARLLRDWAAVLRQTLCAHPTLGGIAEQTAWVGEDYRQIADRSSRTLGGCSVRFDVLVKNALTPLDLSPQPRPTVASTRTTLTVRPTPHQE